MIVAQCKNKILDTGINYSSAKTEAACMSYVASAAVRLTKNPKISFD